MVHFRDPHREDDVPAGNGRMPGSNDKLMLDRFVGHWWSASVDETPMDRNFAKDIHRLPISRRELVFRIRRQIDEGTYESEKKLELAVGRMLDRIAPDEHLPPTLF